MTDHMRGNPHAEASAVKAGVEELNEHWGIAQATLALAYEQRTANLIAFVKLQAEQSLTGGGLELLRKRLGLDHD